MDLSELEASLKARRPAPIYILRGTETFFRRKAARLIAEAMEADGSELSAEAPDPARLDVRDLLDDLRTPTLFAPKRLTTVEPAGDFIVENWEILLTYADAPASAATLILVAEHLDARRNYAKALLKAAAVVDCAPLKDYQVPRWCMARAQAEGKRMNNAAAQLLVELAGVSLGELDGQIRNLAVYCNTRQTISDGDVEKLVGGDHARKVWALTDAVMQRAPAKALKALDRLQREPGAAEFRLIAPLAARLRDMIHVKRFAAAGLDADEIRKRLGRHPYAVKLLREAVTRVSFAELAAKYRLLLEADLEVKTLPARERPWIIQRLILSLCA